MTMTNEQFQTFLDRHGAEPANWPAAERSVAEQLVARDAAAHALLRGAQRLDAALAHYAQNAATDDAAVGRVLTRLARPLPRQKVPFWRLPAVLLDWQFSPAWPRMAALGACAVVGFFVGITGVDRQIDGYSDMANPPNISSVFDSEPLSGWQ